MTDVFFDRSKLAHSGIVWGLIGTTCHEPKARTEHCVFVDIDVVVMVFLLINSDQINRIRNNY